MTEPEVEPLTVGSTFTGVGGFDLGFIAAGARVLWQAENDKRCIRVLRHRFPGVQIIDDVRKIEREVHVERPTVLTGGFPCQDISVAGKRAGLAGERSGLFFEFMRAATLLSPAWVLLENVDGLLSSNEGEDLAVILGELSGFRPAVPADGWRRGGVCVGDLGAVAWRVLDSQYFGVPQRRRRIFLVRHRRAECAVAVLFESGSCDGDAAPFDGSGQTAAGTLGGGSPSSRGSRPDDLDVTGGRVISARDAKGVSQREGQTTLIVASTLTRGGGRSGRRQEDDYNLVASPLRASDGHDSEDGTGRQPAFVITERDVAPTLLAPQTNAEPRDGKRQDGSRRDRQPVVVAGTIAAHRVSPTLMGGTTRLEGGRRGMNPDEPTVVVSGEQSGTLTSQPRTNSNPVTHGRMLSVVFRKSARAQTSPENGGFETWVPANVSNTLNLFDEGDKRAVTVVVDEQDLDVRRLTPTEYERLQGFPDGWTCLEEWAADRPYSTAACRCADGPRYAENGNAVSVPVIEWLARRMVAVHHGRPTS